jgi:hypothetical protein
MMNPDDHRHGTWNGYNNLRCRCEDCTKAARAYIVLRNAKWREQTDSALMRRKKYRIARENGYSASEAGKRSFWTNPLA